MRQPILTAYDDSRFDVRWDEVGVPRLLTKRSGSCAEPQRHARYSVRASSKRYSGNDDKLYLGLHCE